MGHSRCGSTIRKCTGSQTHSEAFPTKDQKAFTVAEILVSQVLTRFRPPTVIHSDHGRYLDSNLQQEVSNLMEVHW